MRLLTNQRNSKTRATFASGPEASGATLRQEFSIVRDGVARLGSRVGLASVPGVRSNFWVEPAKGDEQR